MHKMIALALLAGCGGTSSPDLAPVDKAATCASEFGSAIVAGFGRLDGTIRAVVPPGHPTCAQPNGDHLVLQVDANGATYRMVVNVQSEDDSAPNRYATTDAPLAGDPWAEGWHEHQHLDYVDTLAVHSTAFTLYPMADLVALVTDQLTLGARVSVFATSDGGSRAHDIHRYQHTIDGAIVTAPDTTPRYLLFAFSNLTF